MKLKKIITLIISAVTLLTCMPLKVLATQITTETEPTETGSIENDLSIEGGNSLGNLIADELNGEYSEQLEANGSGVYSIEVTGNNAAVTFETERDCTLVAAVYDENGEQMLASGSTAVLADDTSAEVNIETDAMPQYYVIKAFLIDTGTLKPICTAYESSYYTQEMQEILTLSANDFDEERVLNLDDDNTNNFAIYSESTITAESSGEINKVVSADEESETYVIENPDSRVAALQNGDILACEQENGEVLIVKVESAETDGTAITITGQDTSMEEVFDYVKIDSSKQAGEADYDPSTLSEGLTYEGFTELDEDSSQQSVQKSALSTRAFGEIEDEGVVPVGAKLKVNMAKAGAFTLTGSLSYSAEFSMKLYLSLKRQFIEFKIDNTLKISLTLTGKIEEKISLGSFDMMIFPGVNVGVIPKFVAEASVSFETSGTLTTTIGFNYEHTKKDSYFHNLSTKPCYKDTMKLEGKLAFGVELEPNVSIISSKLVRLGFTGSGKIVISMARELYNSDPDTETDVYHECEVCFAGDIKRKYELSIDLTFLDSDKLKLSKDIASKEFKFKDLYYSVDHNDYNYGTCPWQKYRATIVVLGEDMQPLSAAAVKIDDDEETYMTDTKGVVRFYLPGESKHEITVTCDGFSRTKKFSVESSPKCVYLWMLENSYHQGGGGSLGNVVKEEPFDPTTPTEPAENTPMGAVKEVSLGGGHSAAITEDGSLYMWGYNKDGQLGNGTTENSSTPIKIMDNIKAVSLGKSHSAAITEDGSLYMWGDNEGFDYGVGGQLGNGTRTSSYTPIKIMDNVKSVSLGRWHSAAITEDGSLYMWGSNSEGELGNGTQTGSYTPIKIMDNVKSVSLGGMFSAAITEDGSLYTWGENDFGQLGRPQDEIYFYNHVGYYYGPSPVKIMDNVKSVNLGDSHGGAITEDGSLYMWGYNGFGQIGNGEHGGRFGLDENGDSLISIAPTKIMDNVKAISLGDNHSAAITEDGDLYMWGLSNLLGNGKYGDEYGEDENGIPFISSTPIKIMDNVKAISLGDNHSGAITEDGNLYMWGDDKYGCLGNGTGYESSYTPIKINSVSSVSPASVSGLTNNITYLADEETSPGVSQAQFKNLVPNEIYNLYIMKEDTAEDLLGSDNLLYIDQYTSDSDGNITASYIMKEECEDAIIFLVRMSEILLTAENTEITADDLDYTGESQVVRPVVIYDGKELMPGTDYDIEGAFSAVSAGEYTAVIVGKGNYAGEVEFTYNVTGEQECQHEFVDGVCIICGEECQHEFADGVCTICGESEKQLLIGDVTQNGVIDLYDVIEIAKSLMKMRTFTDEEKIIADYNGDGVVDLYDAIAVARTLLP